MGWIFLVVVVDSHSYDSSLNAFHMINKIFPKINFSQRPYLFLFCRTSCDLCCSFSSQIEGGLLIKMSNSALLDIDLKENEVHELLKL